MEEFGDLLVNRQIEIFENKTNHSSKLVEKSYNNVGKNGGIHGNENKLVNYKIICFNINNLRCRIYLWKIPALFCYVELSSRLVDANNFKGFVFENRKHLRGDAHGLISYPRTLFFEPEKRKTEGNVNKLYLL